MKVFPAIDLMNGKVVRLTKGDPKTIKTYDHLGDPLALAKRWESEGVDGLHIVDLDATLGLGSNLGTIIKIVKETDLPIHVGGGIRSLETAENLLNSGVSKVILGTLAYKKPDVITELKKKFGDCVIIAVDHLNGIVMIEGWTKSTKIVVQEAIRQFLKLNIKTFLLTSIAKDGTFQGVDLEVLSQACSIKEAHIIAAGGISSLGDIAMIKRTGAYGVVIGKALYEGKISLKEAIKIAKKGDFHNAAC